MRQFLDFETGENSAVLVNNFDWMKNFSVHRLPARHWEKFSGQCDDRQGFDQESTRFAGRFELHGIQLYAFASFRFCSTQ